MTTTLAPVERLRERLDLDEATKAELGEIEVKATTYTLADAIREGSTVTDQRIKGWVTEDESCTLGAAYIAAQARGLL